MNNSDLKNVPTYEKPDDDQLVKILNSVTTKWCLVDLKKIKHILPKGEAPSNITDEEIKEIKLRSYNYNNDDNNHNQMGKAPIIWLLMWMKKLQIHPDFIQIRIKNFNSEFDFADLATKWNEAIKIYNTDVKNLKILHTWCKTKTGAINSETMNFFEEKGRSGNDDRNHDHSGVYKKINKNDSYTSFGENNIDFVINNDDCGGNCDGDGDHHHHNDQENEESSSDEDTLEDLENELYGDNSDNESNSKSNSNSLYSNLDNLNINDDEKNICADIYSSKEMNLKANSDSDSDDYNF